MKKITKVIALSTLISLSFGALAAQTLAPNVDDKGNITLPSDFRINMAHLGSWYVPEGGASGFHDVYMNKEAVLDFIKTGKFPDGAVMVKELRHASKGDYTTGPGVKYANDNVKQTFVMVKDSKNRFSATNKSWGDGWGWALIKKGETTNSSTDYKTDCLGCHVPAKDNDWIYTEAYPTLAK